MEKFVPYEKLSRKKRRALDARGRNTWGVVSPVTRRKENAKAYNRKKAQDWKREPRPKPVPFVIVSRVVYLP